jgi:transglutaminase-like putative cysteine protease
MIGYLIMLIVLGTTDASTSAYDTLNQREGVCKDFAHLGIALCRALNIPARYFVMPQILIRQIFMLVLRFI